MAVKHWPFTKPGDYLLSDPNKIEVANGVARLKTGYPADLLFYAKYNTTLDADYSKQGVTVPDYITGDVSIDSSIKKTGTGSLRLAGASSSPYIYYTAQQGFGQTGTISFWRYVNSTLTDADCISIWTNDVNTDILFLVGDPSITQLLFFMYDANGVDVFYLYANDVPNDAWHHVEINFDFAVGVARLFVNGILKDSAAFAPTSMTPGLVDITIGNRTQSVGNAWFDEVRIYNSVHHTANFTPDTQELGGQGYPADLSLYAKFDTDLNLAHNATGNNQPSMQAGSIGITSSGKIGAGAFQGWPSTTNPDLRYNGTTDVGGIGSVCYWYQQSVNGQWVGNDFRIHLSPVSGAANLLTVYHSNSASVSARLYDSAGNEILNSGANFTKSSAWRYVEVNWNCNLGQYRIFIDGVLKQFVSGAPKTRNAAAYLRIEAAGGSIPQVFYVDDLRVYNTVLHTANYTPPDTELIENLYPAGKPYIQPTAAFNPNHVKYWNGFSELLSPNNAGSVRYVLSDDNGSTWKYWNGSGWAAGGNENNNNPADEINSHLATFTLTPDTFLFRAYLISNGSQQVELDNVALDYSHVNYRVNINPDTDFSIEAVKKLSVSANAIDAVEQVSFISWFKVQGILSSGSNLRVLINPTADLIPDTPYKPRISADSIFGDSLNDWATWWFRTLKSFFNLHVLIDPQTDFGEKELINLSASGQTPDGIALTDFPWWFETGLLPPSPYTGLTGEWVNLGEDGTLQKGQLQRFLTLVSFALDEVKGRIDAFPVMLNVDKADADYLPLLAALVGIDFSYDIPIPRQREEIKRAVEIYKTKGSIPGIKRFCRNIIGFDPQIAEWPPRILMSSSVDSRQSSVGENAKLSARITTPGAMDKLGLPGDQAFYSLDFSEVGDYRFDKFGIYFFLAEFAGIPKAAIAKVLRLLPKHIPASTIGRIIFVDHTYSLTADGRLMTDDLYHAFGTGKEVWDSQLEQASPGQTKLVSEVYRRKPDSIVCLDANGWVTTTPTNKIRVVTVLKDSEPGIDGHSIREQGLFANATAEKDSGTLLGAVNHKGQWKTGGYRIRKTIELTMQ